MVCKVCNQEVEAGLNVCPFCGASMTEKEVPTIDIQFTDKKAASIKDKPESTAKKTKKGVSKKNLADATPIKIVDEPYYEEPANNGPIELSFVEPEDTDPTPIKVIEDEELTETIRPLYAKERRAPKKIKSLEKEKVLVRPPLEESTPVEEPEEEPIEEPAPVPETEAVVISEASEPKEEPKEEPTEEPVEEPAEEPVEEPTEEPVEEPAEEPVEEPTEEPVEEPTEEAPVEEAAEETAEETAEEPVEEAAEETAEETAEEPVEETAEEPKEELATEPTEEPIEEVIEEPIACAVEPEKAKEPFLPEEIIEEYIKPEVKNSVAIVEEPAQKEPTEEPTQEEPLEEPVEEPTQEEPLEEPVEEPVISAIVIDNNYKPAEDFLPEEVLEDYIAPIKEEPVLVAEEPIEEEPIEEPLEEEPIEEEPTEEEPTEDEEELIPVAVPIPEEEISEPEDEKEETGFIMYGEGPVLSEKLSKRKLERENKPVKDRPNFFLMLLSLMFPPYLGSFIWITRSSRKPKAASIYGILTIISYIFKKAMQNLAVIVISIAAVIAFFVFSSDYVIEALANAGYSLMWF